MKTEKSRGENKAGTIAVAYQPNARQAVFHRCGADEAVYGGARGGGKSCALVMEALAYGLEHPGAIIYLFRETYDDLEANLIREWLDKVPEALYQYKSGNHTAKMVNGSEVFFRYCTGEEDAAGYQGRSIDFIGIDELTKHTQRTIQLLLACLRSPKGFKPKFRGTCNPGGIGHSWVKDRYVAGTHKGEREYIDESCGSSIAFIPALVYDNEVLMKMDPKYVRRLENLPEKEKKAFLYGDWDIFEGQYFSEWNYEMHVCRPFEIPREWRRYVALDYGFDMLACCWAAFDPRGRGVVYRELYRPNLIVSEAAAEIRRLTHESITQYLSPPDLRGRQKDSGKSILELFAEGGIYLTVVEADRISGWYNLREWLAPVTAPDGGEESRLQIFSCCENLIRCLPQLQMDKQNPNDCATEPHEITHAPDALRYLLSGRPVPGRETSRLAAALPPALRSNKTSRGEMAIWN